MSQVVASVRLSGLIRALVDDVLHVLSTKNEYDTETRLAAVEEIYKRKISEWAKEEDESPRG